MYYVGASPPVYHSFNSTQTPGNLNYVPKPRDQEACNSCVGMAAAAAVEMSLAYTARRLPENFNVSARAMYYCLAGGRTCKTGWDIADSLKALSENPSWMLPDKCFVAALARNPAGSVEPDINNFDRVCRITTEASNDPECQGVTVDQPRYTCSFRSLSSFWQIQQHIRKHGAVITRIAIYDDIGVQFNESARHKTSQELPPYTRNITARLSYGHAAVIVGYDNTNFTWTILNSWGSGGELDNPRKNGITADGMFRIRMGVAGVGTPDVTYGVVCEPAPGSVDNLHGNRPWLTNTRLPLRPIVGDATCYLYEMSTNDTFASVAEHFDVDIRTLVEDNLQLFSIIPDVTYKYQRTLKLDEMQQALSIVQNVTQEMLSNPTSPERGAIEPYFICSHFDEAGVETKVRCDKATLVSNPLCTRHGTVACTLFYSDVNVTQLEAGRVIKVCKGSWTDIQEFNAVAWERGSGRNGIDLPERQQVALRKVLQTIDYQMSNQEASAHVRCSAIEPNSENWCAVCSICLCQPDRSTSVKLLQQTSSAHMRKQGKCCDGI
ncbi:hypothetical protein COO60DRAFT_193116 [Scenedesmus sp. NREL 46B-D3]|nr:hypothetical protein COO60DRAFT_193116 [Scenedesmus sp. NREL 46B-D3]